jgi:hypothetical protein
MFIDIGGGWHVNLTQVTRIHVVDSGPSGVTIKFYAHNNEHLGDCTPSSPEEMQRVLGLVQAFGKT